MSRDRRQSGEHGGSETDGGYAMHPPITDGDSAWPRLRQIGTVAWLEYRLSVRARWAIALSGLFLLFGAMLVTFSGSAVGPDGAARIVGSIVSLAVYLVPLAGLAIGYDTIVGRDAEGWLEVVFSLPVTRGGVVVGAYLGRAAVIGGSIVLGFGIVGLLLTSDLGPGVWEAYLPFLASVVALGLVFLALAVLVSTVVGEKAHALGLALLVWVWFVLVHDLLALGVVAAFPLSEGSLTALVLTNPASVFRVLALSHLGAAGGSGITGALATTGLSTELLASAFVAWVVGPLLTAVLLVRRRRL